MKSIPKNSELQFLEIGVVAKPHGLKGGLVITPWSDTDFSEFSHVFLLSEKSVFELKVSNWALLPKGSWILNSKSVSDRNEAEKLRNYRVAVTKDMVSIEDDEVFLSDMIDCFILNESGTLFGKSVGVMKSPTPYPMLIGKTENNDEFFVPLHEENFIDFIEDEKKIIISDNYVLKIDFRK